MATPLRTHHRQTIPRHWLKHTIIGLELFGGFWTVAGGIGLLTGSIGLSEDYLEGSIFDSYVIPALILMFVVGGALLGAASLMWRHHRLAPEASLVAAATLLGWIVVQLAIVGYISWMQPTVFAFAVVLGALSWWPRHLRQPVS